MKASVIVILKRNDSIYMFKRKNTGWADGDYTVTSGYVDRGETPTEAAIRETYEEVSVQLKQEDLELIHVDFVVDDVIDFTFIATEWVGDVQIKESEKAEEGEWFSIDNLPENIAGHGRKILENIANGKSYLEVTNQ